MNRVQQIIKEEVEKYLSEIDWEGDFKDVKKVCMKQDDLVEWLNQVISNRGKDTKDRVKHGMDKPFFHASSDMFGDKESEDWKEKYYSQTEIDVDDFIKRISTKPKRILGKNAKMEKTGGRHDVVFQTSIPALRGLVYDQDKKKFFIVNTCPGAGSCALVCYALKGSYIRYSESYDKSTRVLNLLLNDPKGFEEQLYQELVKEAEDHGAKKGYKKRLMLRWHDSGDFFSNQYVKIANRIVKRMQKNGYNIIDSAYTKMADVVDDSDGRFTFSDDANKRETDKFNKNPNKEKYRTANITSKDVVKGLDIMKVSDVEKILDRVAEKENLDRKTVISYDQMMDKKEGNTRKWNVVVFGGKNSTDGDDASFRKDVKTIYNVLH